MSLYVDPAARREAVAVRMGEIGDKEIRFGQRVLDMAQGANQPAVIAAAGNLKPRYAGHMGILVADTVELVLQQQSVQGRYALIRYTDGLDSEIRQVTDADVKDLNSLTTSWEHTLMYALARTINNPEPGRSQTNLGITENFWALRKRSIGSSDSLLDLTRGGAQTGASQCFTTTIGMEKYWYGIYPDEDNITPVLRRSSSPLNNAASLEAPQFHQFGLRYQGCRNGKGRNDVSWHDPRLINHSIYTELLNGRIGLENPIEDLPDKKYGSIGNVPSTLPGPRIGCPILLTPLLLKRFWEAYIDSAAHILDP